MTLVKDLPRVPKQWTVAQAERHFGFRLARRGFADPSTRRTLPLTTVGARATPAPSPAPPIALACSDGPGRPTRPAADPAQASSTLGARRS